MIEISISMHISEDSSYQNYQPMAISYKNFARIKFKVLNARIMFLCNPLRCFMCQYNQAIRQFSFVFVGLLITFFYVNRGMY